MLQIQLLGMETTGKVADQLEDKEICDKVEINDEEASDNIRPQHGRFKHSCQQCDYYARDRSSLQIHMKESGILVISVTIKQRERSIFCGIFGNNMKISSILVSSVIIKFQITIVFTSIFSLCMKVSSILVISVIMKLNKRKLFRHIFFLNMKVSTILVSSVIIREQIKVS